MDMIMWIKTNGLAQPMYLVKMKDKPAAFVKEYIKIISFGSEVTCCAHRNTKKLFLVQELSIYGMIFHMKSKVLET